jgi:transcriptional regulator with XRE-family HTH domain
MTRLAERAGLSQQMISYVERGMRNPTLDALLRIAEALGIGLDTVLAGAYEAANGGCAIRRRYGPSNPRSSE